LRGYTKFAREVLQLPVPIRVEAGLVGIKGLPIAVDNSGARGGALTDRIQWQGEILSWDTPAYEFLQPFFAHMWAKCGVVRPESRQAELAREAANG